MNGIDMGITAVLIGGGATAIMDGWLVVLRRAGIPTLNFALLGRWAGHLGRGRLRHAAIAQASPVPGELALGWLTHYGVGIVFAMGFLAWVGEAWLAAPTPVPAIVFGVATVLAPLLLMQPAMGQGIAARKTATPLKNLARSLANHTVFGIGLFIAGWMMAGLAS